MVKHLGFVRALMVQGLVSHVAMWASMTTRKLTERMVQPAWSSEVLMRQFNSAAVFQRGSHTFVVYIYIDIDFKRVATVPGNFVPSHNGHDIYGVESHPKPSPLLGHPFTSEFDLNCGSGLFLEGPTQAFVPTNQVVGRKKLKTQLLSLHVIMCRGVIMRMGGVCLV